MEWRFREEIKEKDYLCAKALTRTSKYGAYALGGLGAIHAAHEIADGENVFKEITY